MCSALLPVARAAAPVRQPGAGRTRRDSSAPRRRLQPYPWEESGFQEQGVQFTSMSQLQGNKVTFKTVTTFTKISILGNIYLTGPFKVTEHV